IHQGNRGARTPSGSAVQIDCDPNCTAKRPDEGREHGRISRLLDKTVDDPLALFTAALAIATMAWALAVRIQVRDARKSSEQQLRAYVSIEPELVLNFEESGKRVGITFSARNHGKTPAGELCVDF